MARRCPGTGFRRSERAARRADRRSLQIAHCRRRPPEWRPGPVLGFPSELGFFAQHKTDGAGRSCCKCISRDHMRTERFWEVVPLVVRDEAAFSAVGELLKPVGIGGGLESITFFHECLDHGPARRRSIRWAMLTLEALWPP